MSSRIYRDKEISLGPLRNKICGVIGFGAQGRAHALNLRDSGCEVLIGLRPRSKSRALAGAAGLSVLRTEEAVQRSDLLFLALTDSRMPKLFLSQIGPPLRAEQTPPFAPGFA